MSDAPWFFPEEIDETDDEYISDPVGEPDSQPPNDDD